MPYRYLEDIAIADAAFEASGKTLEELFIAAADATMNLMVEDLGSIADHRRLPIRLEDDAIDLLLLQFLQELIYLKDAERLLTRISEVHIRREGHYKLDALACGEELDPMRHQLLVDVKAVTLHRFRVDYDKVRAEWTATVVLDI